MPVLGRGGEGTPVGTDDPGEHVLGVDLGFYKTYMSVLAQSEPPRVVGVENQEVAATVKPLLKEYRIALAVVEGLTRWLLRGRHRPQGLPSGGATGVGPDQRNSRAQLSPHVGRD